MITNRMKKEDTEHDWLCVGMHKGTDTLVFTQLKEFALTENHKFITFEQDELLFGVLGVRKPTSSEN